MAMIRTLYTVDDQVDRLMRHLQATGELANTLVIFTSDNGFLQGEHRTTEKFLPYRKAVEVPFLIRSGHTRQRALIEYWHDANNSRTIPTWASIRTVAYQYTEYYDIAQPGHRDLPRLLQPPGRPLPAGQPPGRRRPRERPDTAPLSQALRAARQCAGASCP